MSREYKATTQKLLTALRRQGLQIDFETDVVLRFRLSLHQRTIFASQDIRRAILHEFVPATNVHGKKQKGLSLRRREVESNAIVVDKLNIEGRGPVHTAYAFGQSTRLVDCCTAYLVNFSVSVVWIMTLWAYRG